MHGLICFQLKRYVEHKQGPQIWERLFHDLDLSPRAYQPTDVVPDEEFESLLIALATINGQPLAALMEDFGFFLAPQLVSIYGVMFHAERSTLALLAVTEDVIHRAIRLRQPSTSPPVIKCLWRLENEMELIYSSPRNWCALATGIIRGIAECFDESVTITDRACVHRGDPYCCLAIRVTQRRRVQPTCVPSQDAPETEIAGLLPDTRWLSVGEQLRFGWLPKPHEVGDLGHLAQYRLLRVLGEGGMGVVFLAEDTQLLRTVAIKVLKPNMAPEAEAIRQFVREARAGAGLTSDHVVPIYEIGEDHGLPFVVMPLLVGQTLRDWHTQEVPVLLGWVIEVGFGIATGLVAAHARGLVHRDIKPSNIWLESPKGRVKLMDFGLTISLDDTSQRFDQADIVGTCQYMAPEQATGGGLVPQSDLYSLGVVLYELCTGRLPVEGDCVSHMLGALACQHPQPVREHNPQVPAALESLIMQLLAKDPSDRPATAGAVVSLLETISADLASDCDWEQVVVLPPRMAGEMS
jgi:Protein kinase domain/Haem-NO-binding